VTASPALTQLIAERQKIVAAVTRMHRVLQRAWKSPATRSTLSRSSVWPERAQGDLHAFISDTVSRKVTERAYHAAKWVLTEYVRAHPHTDPADAIGAALDADHLVVALGIYIDQL